MTSSIGQLTSRTTRAPLSVWTEQLSATEGRMGAAVRASPGEVKAKKILEVVTVTANYS